MPDEEDPNEKAKREAQELKARIEVAKRCADAEFTTMLAAERWFEDKIALLKARAAQLFSHGFLNLAAATYTRAIGMHACEGTPAPHTLYGNRSACRCGAGEYHGALADAEECIRLNPKWAKGYVRKGAALHGLYRFDDAVHAYELGLTHDPSLDALTTGLNDALRRKKAAGGEWNEVAEWPQVVPPDMLESCPCVHGSTTAERARGVVLVDTCNSSTLFVCDAAAGRVLALDSKTFAERFAIELADGGTPVSIAAGDDLLVVADGANYQVVVYTADGALVRRIGERASRFATVPLAGHFASPPSSVAIGEGHLFALESGGASFVHVLDPRTGEPRGLLHPPFNAPPLAHATRRRIEAAEAALAAGATLAGVAQMPALEPTSDRHEQHEADASAKQTSTSFPSSSPGCLVSLCVSGESLYVCSTDGGDGTRILRLPRTHRAPTRHGPGHGVQDDAEAPLGADKQELSYRKGFLL